MSKYVVGTWIDGTCYYITDYWFYSKNGANEVSHTIGTLENAIVFDSKTAQIICIVLSMDMYLY
jgi:hypothetical protein